jgi:hypothetical protein
MSPEYQTLLTLALMIVAYYAGHHFGKLHGIEQAIIFFENQGISLTIEDEEEEDE